MELLLGCWLLAREYSNSTMQGYRLDLIKGCMRHITRKDSVAKITSLIGKNMYPPKKYEEIVETESIPLEVFGPEKELSELDTYLLNFIEVNVLLV